MAVFTPVSLHQAQDLLKNYAFDVASIAGISAGVENSNFIINDNQHILTIFERRIDFADLPYFTGLLNYWHDQGIHCPKPVADQAGEYIQVFDEKPALITTFLNGSSLHLWDADATHSAGELLGKLHMAGKHFDQSRANHMGLQTLHNIADHCDVPDIIKSELSHQDAFWHNYRTLNLPYGVIHGDYFADNVFFEKNTATAVIDPYFACNDYFAFDIAIALNAWAMDVQGNFQQNLAQAFIDGYQSIRPLLDPEIENLADFGRLAALRFALTRLHAWQADDTGSVIKKNPQDYINRLKTWQNEDLSWLNL